MSDHGNYGKRMLGTGARPKLTPKQLARLKRDRAAGMTITQLCERYGISPQTVARSIVREDSGELAKFAVGGSGHV